MSINIVERKRDGRTEKEVEKFFDAFIEDTGLFIMEKQVEGHYLFGRNLAGSSGCRLDRILIPTLEAAEAGLTLGPIGVELKSGNETKFGPHICQSIDYRTALFTMFKETQNFKDNARYCCPIPVS